VVFGARIVCTTSVDARQTHEAKAALERLFPPVFSFVYAGFASDRPSFSTSGGLNNRNEDRSNHPSSPIVPNVPADSCIVGNAVSVGRNARGGQRE
jgi:hypothetical protein